MKDILITKKQIEILLLLYKFRFLHTYQFQKLLHHKQSNRIKTWLKDLTEKEYVKRDYTPKKIQKKPAIYFLTKKARKILKQRKECNLAVLNKIYREKERSKTFINRCLLIADIYLSLQKHLKNNETLHYATKTDLIAYDYFPDPLPDVYIAMKNNKHTRRYFLEIIDETLPRFTVRGMIRNLIEYATSEQWGTSTATEMPSVIIVCPYEKMKPYLQRFIAKVLEEEQGELLFYLTTKEAIVTHGIGNEAHAIVKVG